VDSFKTELIADRIWRSVDQAELAILEWVSWFNHDRLHSALGDVPPVEFEALHGADFGRRIGRGASAEGRRTALRGSDRSGRARRRAQRRRPDRPARQTAAPGSLRSPLGLAALDGGAYPTTLP
jgi:Integrase core domain